MTTLTAETTAVATRPLSEPLAPVPRRRQWLRRYAAALTVCDLLSTLAAVVISALLARLLGTAPLTQEHTELLMLGAAAVWLLMLATSGAYEGRILGGGSEEFKRIGNAAVRCGAILAFVAYLTQVLVARGIVVIALPLMVVVTVLVRYASRRVLHRLRARGIACEQVLVVGGGDHAITLVRELQGMPHVGLKVLGVCVPGGRRSDSLSNTGVPVVGSLSNVRMAVQRAGATAVAVAHSPGITPTVLRHLAWELEDLDVDIMVAPGLTDVAGPRIHIRPVSGLPLLHVEQPQFSGFGRVSKGLIDRAAAAFLLLLCAPVLAALAIAIRLDSSGPAFFRQRRVGRDGTEFTLLKFRSMVVNAEDELERIIDLNECTDSLLFKVREDPRITRVGRFLRRYSLDEVPQLFNVLLGHMSLVGPRPPLPDEVRKYDGTVHRRLLVKPGLTGLWQVSGRSDLSWEDGIRLDLFYVENWSPAMDFMILWKTLFAVMRARGAY